MKFNLFGYTISIKKADNHFDYQKYFKLGLSGDQERKLDADILNRTPHIHAGLHGDEALYTAQNPGDMIKCPRCKYSDGYPLSMPGGPPECPRCGYKPISVSPDPQPPSQSRS